MSRQHGAKPKKSSLNYLEGNIVLKFDNGDADIKDVSTWNYNIMQI